MTESRDLDMDKSLASTRDKRISDQEKKFLKADSVENQKAIETEFIMML